MNKVKLVAVFADNTLGQMARITGIIGKVGVNLRWMTIATTESYGVMKFLLDRPAPAVRALKKAGYSISLVDVLAIVIQDQAGGLHAVAECLAQNGINVDNSSGFVVESRRCAVVLIEVKEMARAIRVLRRNKIKTLSERELQRL